MNQETPQDYLERKVAHTAANRGLNQRMDSEIHPRAWSILKHILPIIYGIVCVIPGIVIAYAGLSQLFYLSFPINPFVSAFVVLVGLGATAIGIYLMRFILKQP